jgi:hypothetical protein
LATGLRAGLTWVIGDPIQAILPVPEFSMRVGLKVADQPAGKLTTRALKGGISIVISNTDTPPPRTAPGGPESTSNQGASMFPRMMFDSLGTIDIRERLVRVPTPVRLLMNR